MQDDQPEIQSKESRLQLEMASWVYQSHLWKRNNITGGYQICEWCGHHLHPGTAMLPTDQLCPENPKIKEMRRAWVRQVIIGIKEAEELITQSRTSFPSKEAVMLGGIGYGKTIKTTREER